MKAFARRGLQVPFWEITVKAEQHFIGYIQDG
jgi:hypothetical protein